MEQLAAELEGQGQDSSRSSLTTLLTQADPDSLVTVAVGIFGELSSSDRDWLDERGVRIIYQFHTIDAILVEATVRVLADVASWPRVRYIDPVVIQSAACSRT